MSTIAIQPRSVQPRPVRARSIQAPSAPARPVPSGSMRLTRRGRLAVFAVTLAALLGAAVAVGSATIATGEAGSLPQTRIVSVQPGQTLWQLAGEANPRGDVQQTVRDIMELNALDSAAGLQIGRKLAVPVYGR